MRHALFIFTCLVWGSSFILMKKAGQAWGPLGIGTWRLLCGAAVLLIVWFAQRRRWPLTRRDAPGAAFIALVSYGWPFALQPWFINRYGSALMGIFICFVPLLTIVMSIPMLRVRPTRRQLVGVVLGLLLLLLLMGDAALSQHVPWQGVLLAFTVPLNYAIVNTFVKRRFAETPAMPLTAAALALAGLVLLPLSLGFEHVETANHFRDAVAAMALLAVVCTGAGYFVFYRLVQDHGPLYAGMVSYLIPLIAMGWGWLDGEKVTARQVLIVVGVLVAVAMVQWRGKGKPAVQTVGAGLAE